MDTGKRPFEQLNYFTLNPVNDYLAGEVSGIFDVMQATLKNMVLVLPILFGSLVLYYPFVSSMAQKDKYRQSADQVSLMKVVRRNVVGNRFYDALQRQERDWVLTNASLFGGQPVVTERGVSKDANSILLVLKKRKTEVRVIIQEYSSDVDAKMPLTIEVSQGRADECKSEECGDGGQKTYRPKGEFSSLGFRKGSFYVAIHCNSENVAKRFAGYALNAIGNR